MKRFIIKAIIFIIPILSIICAINYIIDPGQVFGDGDFERQVAAGQNKGMNVIIDTNYDEREEQRFFIDGLTEKPDGLILGSSRVLGIPPEAFGFESGVNSGLSGASIKDLIPIVGIYHERNLLPDFVVIGVDPWMFNDNSGETRHEELAVEYMAFAPTLGINVNPGNRLAYLRPVLSRCKNMLSLSYFQESLKAGIKGSSAIAPTAQYTTDAQPQEKALKLADGSMVYGEDLRSMTTEEVIQSVNETIASGVLYQSENFTVLSPDACDQFNRLVTFLRENEIDVQFVLTPFHPYLYSYIQTEDKYKEIILAEAYIRQYASENDILIIGSYDPSAANASNDDFYDYMHPKREYMALLCAKNNAMQPL